MKSIYLFIVCLCSLLPMGAGAQTFTCVDINPGADSSSPGNFISCNNKLYFTAIDGVHGRELWVSDGTPGGTQIVSDIWPGARGSNADYFIVYNNKLYFTADDSVHGFELWVTDGTQAGTQMVSDINPGHLSSDPANFIVFNNKLYFSATDATHGSELWTSDGTAAGTTLVADIWPGVKSSRPGYYSQFYAFNGQLYFNATDSLHGSELWTSDGTTAGTVLLADISPGLPGSYAGLNTFSENNAYGYPGFTAFNNQLFFEAADTVHGYELWVTDGTNAGTQLLKDILPGKSSSYPGYNTTFTAYNNQLYFGADDSVHGNELWVTDGTTAGTQLVADLVAGTTGSYPGLIALFNNQMFYPAQVSSENFQVVSSNGTPTGTQAVTNKFTTGTFGFNPTQFITFNNTLFFNAHDSLTGTQLFSLNAAGTVQLLQPAIAPNVNPLWFNYGRLYPFNGSLAFAGDYNGIGNELWFYTPVPAAVGQVQALNGINIYPNPFNSNLSLTGLQNGVEYHLALSDIQGRTIQQYQVTGTGATNTLNLPASLAGGIYLLQISNGGLPAVTGDTGAAETVKIVRE